MISVRHVIYYNTYSFENVKSYWRDVYLGDRLKKRWCGWSASLARHWIGVMLSSYIMSAVTHEPEFSFRDDVLSIRSGKSEIRLRYIPEPCAEERLTSGMWTEVWPDFCIIPPTTSRARMTTDASKAKREAFSAFSATIPSSIRTRVAPFATHQWMLLLMLHRSEKGRDLAEANPVLAYALANSNEFRNTTYPVAAHQALYHVRDKQKDICAWLGFPCNLSVVRIFKRLDPFSVTPSRLRRLRLILNDNFASACKLLSHRTRVTGPIIDLVGDPKIRPVITSNLLDEMSRETQPEVSSLSDELFHAVGLSEMMTGECVRRRISSLESARRFVEDTDAQYLEYRRRMEEAARLRREAMLRAERQRAATLAGNRAKNKRRDPRKCKWPPAPVPGTENIIPITSYAMLCEESDQQNNCIKSYWESITGPRSRTYAYRLLAPERATFTIVKRAGGVWALSQIKSKSNGGVSKKTRRMVEKWLYGYSTSASLPF